MASGTRSRAKAAPPQADQLPRRFTVTWRELASISPYPNNPRKNEHAIADVRASLVEFGWQQPIVVDAKGVIVVGHTRYYAALDMGQTHAPVHVADYLTPAQVKAYRLADNKIGERAEWDFAKLAVEFEGLDELGYDLAHSGFKDFEIGPIRASEWEAPEADGALGGEKEGESADPEDDPTGSLEFDESQWPTVVRAVRAIRKEQRTPKLPLNEAVVRICMKYAPGKGRSSD